MAITYKKESEKITSSGFDTKIYFPAMQEFEGCIYKNIGSDRYVCERELETPKELIISGGMIGSKATFLPQPIYPEEAKEKKISGRVNVIVLVDYDGAVISAKAVSGQKELFETAVQAAKEARFMPTIVSGKPVKLSGVLIYDFVLE